MAVFKTNKVSGNTEKKADKKKEDGSSSRKPSLSRIASRRMSLMGGDSGGDSMLDILKSTNPTPRVNQIGDYAPHISVKEKSTKDSAKSKNDLDNHTVVELLYRLGPNRWTFDITYPSGRVYVGAHIEVGSSYLIRHNGVGRREKNSS